jgi:hypothetical protein
MSKENPLTISPDLTIPGFTVKVEHPHSCQVKSNNGHHQFSARINEGNNSIQFSGPMFPTPLQDEVGEWCWGDNGFDYLTDVDDLITHVANSLRLMDQLSSEGVSAKIDGYWLVLSHPSKPDYSLRMHLTDARKFAFCADPSIYTTVEYCGPAYDKKINAKWNVPINTYRLIVTNKGFEELAQELKARVLSLGEEKDPRIAQWVSEALEEELAPQGFTFSPKPEKTIVEVAHPIGLSGSLSFAAFTRIDDIHVTPKFPNPQFPTDRMGSKVVLFTCCHPNIQEPFSTAWSANEPSQAIYHLKGILACSLVYQKICNDWKSDILIPKLNGGRLQLVNTKIKGHESIILDLNPRFNALILNGMGEELSYPIPNTPTIANIEKITGDIIEKADQHVQKFIRENRLTSKILEVDL